MHLLELTAFIVAATVTVLRAPSAVRNPQSRLSWGAILVAACAFGARVDLSLDRFLGGTNLISLIQNLCAVTAFWLFAQAALNQHHRQPIRWWHLPVLLSLFTVPFLLIRDRGTTSDTFIVDKIAQTGTWLYASTYMAVFGFIAVSLLARLRGRQPRAYRFFLVGCVLIIAACLDEIVSLTLDHFGVPAPVIRDVLRNLFDPLFYPGTTLGIFGIASFASVRVARERRLHHHARILDHLAKRLGAPVPTPHRAGRPDPILGLYDRVIALRDHETLSHTTLSPADARRVAAAEALVMRYLAGPTDLTRELNSSRPIGAEAA